MRAGCAERAQQSRLEKQILTFDNGSNPSPGARQSPTPSPARGEGYSKVRGIPLGRRENFALRVVVSALHGFAEAHALAIMN